MSGAKRHSEEEYIVAVRANEPASTSEVAEAVGVSRQGADWRLRKIEENGDVHSKKIGASLVWFTSEGNDE